MVAMRKTEKRFLTRRGVFWLGQTCNLRCFFCYFIDRINDREHPEHAFMSLEKAKAICDTLRFQYGNNAVDIQGGEPTIYRHIHELVRHCRDIGLMPTLITNAITLSSRDKCQRLKDAGLNDLLVSVHGLGQTYDTIVGCPGGSERQLEALHHMSVVGIPIRFNLVVTRQVLPQMMAIMELARDVGCRAINFLSFNSFEDQSPTADAHKARFSDVGEHLNPALDFLEAAGIEANVRYLPLCTVAPRHFKSMYNFQQLSYDPHEWDFASWFWTEIKSQRVSTEPLSPVVKLRDLTYPNLAKLYATLPELDPDPVADFNPVLYRDHCRLRTGPSRYVHAAACQECAARKICDGLPRNYAALYGVDEVRPIRRDTVIEDPTHFIARQIKVVEEQDWEHAFPAAPLTSDPRTVEA